MPFSELTPCLRFSSVFALQFSGKWTLSQKTSPWPRPFMTRSLCLCRKISKDWVSVQFQVCYDSDGRPILIRVWQRFTPPCHVLSVPWDPGAGQPSPTFQAQGKNSHDFLSSRKTIHSKKAATLGHPQDWGWGFCLQYRPSQSPQDREGSQRQSIPQVSSSI